MTFLECLALAHQKHEGYGTKKAVTINANNNPGALRWNPAQAAFGGVDAPGYTWFPSYAQGFAALKADLTAKITGHSAHIDYSKNPTFLDYVKVYAPAADRNNPTSYALDLIVALRDYGIALDTPLSSIAPLLNSEPPKPAPLRVLTRSVALRLANRLPGLVRSRLLKRLAVSPKPA